MGSGLRQPRLAGSRMGAHGKPFPPILLLETPQANLVSGMQWLLSTFSQGWNHARLRRGHAFQGRYKSVPVTGGEADAYYFRMVADYIHLNPARAGLACGHRGPLTGYKWSSLPSYIKGNGLDWLMMERGSDGWISCEMTSGERFAWGWQADPTLGAVTKKTVGRLGLRWR